jgi:hypothetical protein
MSKDGGGPYRVTLRDPSYVGWTLRMKTFDPATVRSALLQAPLAQPAPQSLQQISAPPPQFLQQTSAAPPLTPSQIPAVPPLQPSQLAPQPLQPFQMAPPPPQAVPPLQPSQLAPQPLQPFQMAPPPPWLSIQPVAGPLPGPQQVQLQAAKQQRVQGVPLAGWGTAVPAWRDQTPSENARAATLQRHQQSIAKVEDVKALREALSAASLQAAHARARAEASHSRHVELDAAAQTARYQQEVVGHELLVKAMRVHRHEAETMLKAANLQLDAAAIRVREAEERLGDSEREVARLKGELQKAQSPQAAPADVQDLLAVLRDRDDDRQRGRNLQRMFSGLSSTLQSRFASADAVQNHLRTQILFSDFDALSGSLHA